LNYIFLILFQCLHGLLWSNHVQYCYVNHSVFLIAQIIDSETEVVYLVIPYLHGKLVRVNTVNLKRNFNTIKFNYPVFALEKMMDFFDCFFKTYYGRAFSYVFVLDQRVSVNKAIRGVIMENNIFSAGRFNHSASECRQLFPGNSIWKPYF